MKTNFLIFIALVLGVNGPKYMNTSRLRKVKWVQKRTAGFPGRYIAQERGTANTAIPCAIECKQTRERLPRYPPLANRWVRRHIVGDGSLKQRGGGSVYCR